MDGGTPIRNRRGGTFSVILGTIVPIDDSVFNQPGRWLGITVGMDPELMPRTRLVSVGYSQRVSTVDGSTGGIISGDVSIQSDLFVSGKATIGPGHTNTGAYAFVVGENNTASGDYSTVGGGESNQAIGYKSTVGGGEGNVASDSGSWSAIGGGYHNTTEAPQSIVAGGHTNIASGTNSFVGAGYANIASGYNAFVGAGQYNNARGDESVVCGGGGPNADSNVASGYRSFVGAGFANIASGYAAVVCGGNNNEASNTGPSVVAGGSSNTASGIYATVGGGHDNTASGEFSTVPGGNYNLAVGDYSFAAGRKAKANHDGSFVWGGQTNSDFSSQRTEQFRVRANGGVRFDINNGRWLQIYDDGVDVITTSMGAHLTIGGVWTNASDRNLKENFSPVDSREILEKIVQLPITQWNYRSENDDITHIGPVAQDFYSLFGLGGDDKSIAALDEVGVALAAIQELHRVQGELKEKVQRIEKLEAQIAQLTSLVETVLANQQEVRNNGSEKLASSR